MLWCTGRSQRQPIPVGFQCLVPKGLLRISHSLLEAFSHRNDSGQVREHDAKVVASPFNDSRVLNQRSHRSPQNSLPVAGCLCARGRLIKRLPLCNGFLPPLQPRHPLVSLRFSTFKYSHLLSFLKAPLGISFVEHCDSPHDGKGYWPFVDALALGGGSSNFLPDARASSRRFNQDNHSLSLSSLPSSAPTCFPS